MNDRRLWLALVLALFCLPLFVGLGRGDIRGDEAIYSFAVDRMLETGDWLEPKSIPNEDWAFLEKPPLKFWIVAAPIRWGFLPHDEFGLRFWDALFGGLGFVYVFLIGSRLAGPMCGTVAVLVLFVHGPLLFAHGLRSNNMEAALFLAYCGGVFHFMRWADGCQAGAKGGGDSNTGGTERVHAYAFGLYFVLGFMTKFVAVLFLPTLVASAAILSAPCRANALRTWKLWLAVSAVSVALIAPWFLWATFKYGRFLWDMMLAEHVYERFTAYLDPNHVQPWYFYVTTMTARFVDSGVAYLVAAGMVLLLAQTVRRRWLDGLIVLAWAIVPISVMSVGTSKIYHYTYPFLPPFALAVGYLATLLILLAPVPFGRAMAAGKDYLRDHLPGLSERLRVPLVRSALLATAIVSVGIAVYTIVFGAVHLTIGGRDVFRSSGVFRPAMVAFFSGTLAGAVRGSSRALVAVLVASMLPVAVYRRSLNDLTAGEHPMRSVRDCLLEVQSEFPGLPRGLYVDVPPAAITHPLYYYFRSVRPWERAPEPSPGELARPLDTTAAARPVLVWEPTYQEFWHRSPAALATARRSPDMVVFEDVLHDVLLLLPGPYDRCGTRPPSSD